MEFSASLCSSTNTGLGYPTPWLNTRMQHSVMPNWIYKCIWVTFPLPAFLTSPATPEMKWHGQGELHWAWHYLTVWLFYHLGVFSPPYQSHNHLASNSIYSPHISLHFLSRLKVKKSFWEFHSFWSKHTYRPLLHKCMLSQRVPTIPNNFLVHLGFEVVFQVLFYFLLLLHLYSFLFLDFTGSPYSIYLKHSVPLEAVIMYYYKSFILIIGFNFGKLE